MENKKDELTVQMSIIIAGILISGSILLGFTWIKSNNGKTNKQADEPKKAELAPISKEDRIMGDLNAKISVIMYEDFQCPWCGKFHSEAEKELRDKYLPESKVNLVYRDFAFLGTFIKPPKYSIKKDESIKSAEAARCAGDQGKFWDYHDYLFDHQNGENAGGFSNANLKSFAQTLGLNTISFNLCLDNGKYTKAVEEQKSNGVAIGVTGTPKGFILKNGEIVDTIDGYLPTDTVTAKIDKVLK